MKRYTGIFLLALVTLVACGHGDTIVSSGDDRDRIEVSGMAAMRMAPDIALVRMGIRVRDKDFGEALAQNTESAEALMAVLEGEGIAAEDIQTTDFNVWDDWSSSGLLIGYWVSNRISAKIRDLARVGEILQAAIEAGDNVYVEGLDFALEDPDSVRQNLRMKAVEDARQRAEVLAEAAGVQLGKAIQIREVVSSGGWERAASAEPSITVDASVPVQPGTLEVSVRVEVVFEIRG